MNKQHPYCEQFGFDQEAIEMRLLLMDMGTSELQCSEAFLDRVIHPMQQQIVDDFYIELMKKPEFMHIINKEDHDLARLKKTQTDYLSTLGKAFNTPDYFNARLKIGWVHFQVGVPLSLYQSAYRILQELFIRAICNVFADDKERMTFIDYALKVSCLDMSLAVSAYHSSKVNDLEDSLRNIQFERLQLMQKASTDELTGLPNREIVKRRLTRELIDLCNHKHGIFLIMADLDYFKKINDEYGHLTGDYVLKGVAARIRQSLRGTDMVGRYGGEEFIVLLINKTEQQAELIAERIRAHVDEAPYNANGQEINISLSQGLACAYADDTADTLIERADKALYEAKRSGRNCVVTARC
jgi:diguanylate cyclase (GGDEF)-like protein